MVARYPAVSDPQYDVCGMPPGLTSPFHLLVIIVVALIVLGPEKLPQAFRQAGKALAEVRRWSQDLSVEMRDVLSVDPSDEHPSAPSASPPTLDARPLSRPEPAGSSAKTPLHPALREGGEWS
jgi:Tat protein translocase TatB subunit